MNNVVNIYLVRHGETDENRAMIMQGQLDTKLNAAGLEQAQLAANALENVRFVAAYSSDLSRAAMTAQTIIAKHPGVPLQTYKALRERHMGSLQGTKIDRSRRVGLPPDAESAEAFSAQQQHIQDGDDSKNENENERTNILVVSHGGLMHVLVQGLLSRGQIKFEQSSKLGLLTRHWFPNASVSVIELPVQMHSSSDDRGVTMGMGTVVLFADTTHLSVEFVNGNADIVDV
ncbi:histidine phosphatase superfamily [Irpex rosettiformis]|uniref:Histidine phosphatase superfamily n=1 Tax=Irpex rosettiformis TaxID=378272 RepID=A0ACB8TVW5_9APHY|nr:histidine phosphatase superfamily [Irpex rosettiformis]